MQLKDFDIDSTAVSKYHTYAKINDKCLPLIAIREGDLKKIEGMANFVELKTYISDAVTKMKTNQKLYIKWRHANIGAAISNRINSNLKDEKLAKELNAAAPNAAPTKMLRLAKRLEKKLEDKDGRLDIIGHFVGWDSAKLVSKYSKRIDKCYEAMLNRYPLMKAYSDWNVRTHISPEHLAKYVSVM